MSFDEIALVLDISTRTVKRDWSMARAWLHDELSKALMTPDKYRRLKPLFEQALDTPPEQRAAFILKVRMADEELGRELESLVESHSGGFKAVRLIAVNRVN